MTNTKHDLSAGIAKLNFVELKEAVSVGVGYSLWACERALSSVQLSNNARDTMNAANELANNAEALRKTSVSLFYMEEAQTREEIQILR